MTCRRILDWRAARGDLLLALAAGVAIAFALPEGIAPPAGYALIPAILGGALGALCIFGGRPAAGQDDLELRLREGEAELTALADAVPVFIWCLTPEGDPCFINRPLANWIGIDPSRLERETRCDLAKMVCTEIHPDDWEGMQSQLIRSLKTGAPFAHSYRHRKLDGSFGHIDAQMEALRNEAGRIVRWYGVARDIGDELQAKASLQETRECLARATQLASLATLSASIAHEVNQPFTAILANAQACRNRLTASPPDLAKVGILLDRIAGSAASGAAIVTRTKALFQGRTEHRVSSRLNDLVIETCRLMREQLGGRGINVALSLDPAMGAIQIDPVQLQQLLVNLIRNAAEALQGSPSRRIEISTMRRPADCRIIVRDHGCGFAEEEILFQPFATNKPGGLGMGLAICRMIADSHCGTLRAERAEPGTRMILDLPTTSPSNRSTSPEIALHMKCRGNGRMAEPERHRTATRVEA